MSLRKQIARVAKWLWEDVAWLVVMLIGAALCILVSASTWWQLREHDPAFRAAEWYMPLSVSFFVPIPASMLGPLMAIFQRAKRDGGVIETIPWVAWITLGLADWLFVSGLWLWSCGVLDYGLVVIGKLASIVASLVVGLWFVGGCVDRIVYKVPEKKRNAETMFFICGIIACWNIFECIYGFAAAEGADVTVDGNHSPR